jgi:hypothetical protein
MFNSESHGPGLPSKVATALEVLNLLSPVNFGVPCSEVTQLNPREQRAKNAALDLLTNYLTGEITIPDAEILIKIPKENA